MNSKGKRLILYTDGAAKGNPGPAGIGLVLLDEAGNIVEERSSPIGRATNNEAEYRALAWGLERAIAFGAKSIDIYLDSELVVMQIQGLYRVKNERLREVHNQIELLLDHFDNFVIRHVPRALNRRANDLAQSASRTGNN